MTRARLSSWSVVAAAVSIGVLANACASAQPAPSASRLVGRYWKAVELGGTPSPSSDRIREVHLRFDSDGRVAGSDGCNGVSGTYTVDGDTLTFGQFAATMMACPDTQATEKAFRDAVTATARWSLTGDRLELLDAAGAVVARFVSPVDGAQVPGGPPPEPVPSLAGTAWQLVRFEGGDDSVLTPDERSKYTLQFDEQSGVTARLDCNRGRGTWMSTSPGHLEFGPLALTRAMCPPGSLHDHIVKQWPYVRSYVMKDGHLFLALMADGGIYEFEPVP